MSNYHQDQAAGLRRMMATPKPRIMSIISASSNQQPSRLISNLAASIHAQGSDVLVVNAAKNLHENSYLLENMPALLDVAHGYSLLDHTIAPTQHGFAMAKLTQLTDIDMPLDEFECQQLNFLLEELAYQHDIVLVDTALNQHNMLPLPILNESEILIQLSRQADSIKHAYRLIKQICHQLGRRNFSIVVDDATEAQAQVIFDNLASVAWRYLRIQLAFFGAIPTDGHLTRAAQLGRPVVDAFPLALASAAFQKIAARLDSQYRYSAHPHHDANKEHASII